MKRNLVIPLATAICICTAPLSAHAHHSYGLFYDLCTSVTIEGRVVNVQWKNPHVWIDLTLDDGTAYHAEWTSLRSLTAAGTPADLATEALKAGDRVIVTGSPMRDRALLREHYPALTGETNPNVVSALTQIRRASDGWSWARATGTPPPECARK